MVNIAGTRNMLGDHKRAGVLLEGALDIQRRALPPGQPNLKAAR